MCGYDSLFPKSAVELEHSSINDNESSGAGEYKELGNGQKFISWEKREGIEREIVIQMELHIEDSVKQLFPIARDTHQVRRVNLLNMRLKSKREFFHRCY